MLPQRVSSLVNEVINKHLGISRKKVLINTLQSGIKYKNNLQDICFILEVPYADTYLNWEVQFGADIAIGPDFNFVNDTFLSDPDIDLIERELPSLAYWHKDNDLALMDVLEQLLSLYKKFQVDKLQVDKFTRQLIDYNELINEMKFPKENVEVYVDQSDVVKFLIKVSIELPALPPYLEKFYENKNDEYMVIKITYNASRMNSELWLSKNLQELTRSPSKFNYVKYRQSSTIQDHVESTKSAIIEQLNEIGKSYSKRNEFLSTLLANPQINLLEYDCVKFRKIVMLVNINNSNCLLTLEISEQFPREKPSIKIQSISHKEPIVENVKNFQFSGKDSTEIQVKKIVDHLAGCYSSYKHCFLEV